MITLRDIEISDTPFLLKWKNDKEVFRYLGGGYNPITYEKQEEITENMIKDQKVGKTLRYIILLDNKPIGLIGLYNINANHNCEFGLYIGEKDQWGKGYASKAYDLVENIAKEKGIKKIKLVTVSENKSAINLYLKKGYREVGVYKEDRIIDGVFHDVTIMEKLI